MDLSQWEAALKKELKTEQIERFLKRALPEGGEQQLLSQRGATWAAPAGRPAALSYTFTGPEDLAKSIEELGKLGVWDFIVDPFLLSWDEQTMHAKLAALHIEHARLWVLGPTSVGTTVIHACEVQAQGGHAVHEMAQLLVRLIEWAQTSGAPVGVAVTCDRELFKSIAKLRAMKAITQHMLGVLNKTELFERITWIGRSSWRDFTSFDAASNILRNATALCAAFIARADVVESLPYDLLIDADASVRERAQRLMLTSQLVLQQEANLGEVADAASGSFALEELTRTLGEQAWAWMQKLTSGAPSGAFEQSISEHWEKTRKQFDTRRLVQTGVNDFPEAHERVKLKARFQKQDHVRLGQGFEALRLSAPSLKVAVAVVGDYANLNARLSFTKNFFELLGLDVVESGKGLNSAAAEEWLKETGASVWALVAADADHEQLAMAAPSSVRVYLAGKTTKAGMVNIFAGMDVRAALNDLSSWGRGAR